MSTERLAAARRTIECLQKDLGDESARLAAFVKSSGAEAFSGRTKNSIDLEALKRRIDSIKERVDGLAKEVESGLDLVAQLSSDPAKEAAKEKPAPDPDEKIEELEFRFNS